LQKPSIQFLRKSKSFWKILGEKGIFSHIIRVPISYPPEKFNGALLSAMCTPDLLGTQGSFSYYSNHPRPTAIFSGGKRFQFEKREEEWCGILQGPDHPLISPAKPLTIRFRLKVDQEGIPTCLQIGRNRYPIMVNEFTPWIPVSFRAGWLVIRGMCQFYLKVDLPLIELYVSPINVDPERPVLPISTPHYFSNYLSKLHGRYSTLGLAEDTWALNEGVLDEEGFLKQAYHLFEEREKQFFHILSKMSRGVCACVFDGTDRIQHMFFRYLDKDHPANCHLKKQQYPNAIADVYHKADEIIGRVLRQLSKDTLFLVLSDHGFTSFQRGVNLNAWLLQQGYLILKDDSSETDYLQNVDWSRTRAYALGLAGIYLNLQGRESQGIVARRDAALLRKELVAKLSGLYDPERQTTAINAVFEAQLIYDGPYLENAPDLIVAYNEGYRISWAGALGKTTRDIFEDNTKNWSGDHGVDPRIVPGILASNLAIKAQQPHIADVAPTLLDLFGIDIPAYMDGKPWSIDAAEG
ncbi:MAG: nucleotide pyrophosphatase, partial [Calditrichaeota bacterium]